MCLRVCIMWRCDAVTGSGVYDNAVSYILSFIGSCSCKCVLQFKVTYKPHRLGWGVERAASPRPPWVSGLVGHFVQTA